MIVSVWIVNVFGVYFIAQLVAAVWWASNIATTLNFMKESLGKMEIANALYSTKPEVAKDFAYRDAKIDAAWKKIDHLEETKVSTSNCDKCRG